MPLYGEPPARQHLLAFPRLVHPKRNQSKHGIQILAERNTVHARNDWPSDHMQLFGLVTGVLIQQFRIPIRLLKLP